MFQPGPLFGKVEGVEEVKDGLLSSLGSSLKGWRHRLLLDNAGRLTVRELFITWDL